jgi:hypothetical protein
MCTYIGALTLFRDLVPREVKLISTNFKSRLQSLIGDVIAEANQATNLSRSLLSDVGLPGSLESYKTQGGLPDSLWMKIQYIQSINGITGLRMRQLDVDGKASRSSNSLDGLAQAIEQEKKESLNFKTRYPEYPGMSSIIALQAVNDTLISLRDAFASARMADASISDLLSDHEFKSSMELLTRPRAELAALLPGGHGGGGKVDTKALEDSIILLDKLLNERERLVVGLSQQADRDVTDIILARFTTDSPTKILDDLLAQSSVAVEAIRSSVNAQSQVVDAIMSAHQDFISARHSDPRAVEMGLIMSRIEQSISKFHSTQSRLAEASTFYATFQTRISGLSQTIDDICYSQHIQRADHEGQATLQFSRQTQVLDK